MITWRDEPCFWWYRDQIQCSGADDAQKMKLTQIARALSAYAVGDDGERYVIEKGFFGREKLKVITDRNFLPEEDKISVIVFQD